jgi:hypothetical protein
MFGNAVRRDPAPCPVRSRTRADLGVAPPWHDRRLCSPGNDDGMVERLDRVAANIRAHPTVAAEIRERDQMHERTRVACNAALSSPGSGPEDPSTRACAKRGADEAPGGLPVALAQTTCTTCRSDRATPSSVNRSAACER